MIRRDWLMNCVQKSLLRNKKEKKNYRNLLSKRLSKESNQTSTQKLWKISERKKLRPNK